MGYRRLLENDDIDFLKPFEALPKDLTALYRKNNGKIGNVFFKISVDLSDSMCGVTPQKDVTMISIGKLHALRVLVTVYNYY